MSRDKSELHSELVTAYELACTEYKRLYPDSPQPFITCTHRTDDEQNKLYAIGRTEKGSIVTNAQAGQSPHNFMPSMAFDIAFITLDKKLSWDSKHFRNFAGCLKNDTVDWGGSWKFTDNPHFELKAWSKIVSSK
jgi:peptidoglycan L-alanyl-D-glutamate endopeptidase CwlK